MKAWQKKKINKKRKITDLKLKSLDRLYESIRENCMNEYNIRIVNSKDIKETYEFLKDNRINNKISDDLKNIINLMIEYFKNQDKKIRGYIM